MPKLFKKNSLLRESEDRHGGRGAKHGGSKEEEIFAGEKKNKNFKVRTERRDRNEVRSGGEGGRMSREWKSVFARGSV